MPHLPLCGENGDSPLTTEYPLDKYFLYTEVPIWEKYTLTIEEAEKYFRIGEKKLCQLADEHPNANWLIMNGSRVQIKRKQFEKMIDSMGVIYLQRAEISV